MYLYMYTNYYSVVTQFTESTSGYKHNYLASVSLSVCLSLYDVSLSVSVCVFWSCLPLSVCHYVCLSVLVLPATLCVYKPCVH